MKRSIAAVGLLLMGLLVIPFVIPPATAVFHDLWMPPQSHAQDRGYDINPEISGFLYATSGVRVVISDEYGIRYDKYGRNHQWYRLHCRSGMVTVDVYNNHPFNPAKINYEIRVDGEHFWLNLVPW